MSTFNSLFRDHDRSTIRYYTIDSENFQLPLSGSLDKLILTELDTNTNLSTPSFGITEPDSGIFRLSAAFCRGTSSHK